MNANTQAEIEVRTLTAEITQLAEQLMQHVKDAATRQTMTHLVNERKARLRQIKEVDLQHYISLAHELGVRA